MFGRCEKLVVFDWSCIVVTFKGSETEQYLLNLNNILKDIEHLNS